MTGNSIHIAIPEPTSALYVEESGAYNLRSLPQYLHALIAAGATPIPIPLHETQARVAKILSTCAGVLLPGSPADVDPQKYGEEPVRQCAPPDPARAAVDELLIQDAFNLYKPVLAICQGVQAVNVWCGGSLVQDIPSQVGEEVDHAPGREVLEAHAVEVTAATRLSAMVPKQDICRCDLHGDKARRVARKAGQLPMHDYAGHLYVNSSHHQAVSGLGDNLAISAISPRDGVIEGLELQSEEHFVVGVQWHPERSYNQSAFSRNIFAGFVEAARTWVPRRVEESVV